MKSNFLRSYNILDCFYSVFLYLLILSMWIITPILLYYIGLPAILAFLIFPNTMCLFFRNSISSTVFALWYLAGVRIKFIGLENMPKERCILASNHSFPDVFFINLLRSDLSFVYSEYMSVCGFVWDCIQIKVHKRNVDFLAKASQIFKTRSICIYPEADLIPYGVKVRYRRGVAILARELGCKVVPITHNFAEVFSGPLLFIKRVFCIRKFQDRDKLWIKIHPPVTYDSLLSKEFPETDESSFIEHNSPFCMKKAFLHEEREDHKKARIFADRLQMIIDGAKGKPPH